MKAWCNRQEVDACPALPTHFRKGLRLGFERYGCITSPQDQARHSSVALELRVTPGEVKAMRGLEALTHRGVFVTRGTVLRERNRVTWQSPELRGEGPFSRAW